MDRSFDHKFGPAPAWPRAVPMHSVLLGQLVASVVVLAAVQPPFAMRATHGEGVPTLCLPRVLAVALLAVSLTWSMHACGVGPGETFRCACEVAHRALR